MEFKDSLYEARKRKGLSQEELANACLVSRQAVSKWENGTSKPDSDNLILIARCLDVSIDKLLGNEIKQQENVSAKDLLQALDQTYEFKSKTTIFGIPLVHIHVNRISRFGLGKRKVCKAKGIIAIGHISVGLISIGFLSAGLFSFGLLSLGLVFSFGMASVGAFAFGVLSLGYIAVGAIAIGMYSFGAIAIASEIAIGGLAHGKYALGSAVSGEHAYRLLKEGICTAESLKIKEVFANVQMPGIIRWVINMLLGC